MQHNDFKFYCNNYIDIIVQVITWRGRCEQPLFQLTILRGFCELSGYWPLSCQWTTVRSWHHFALHLRLIYTQVLPPFNTMLPILLRRLHLYYFEVRASWSRSDQCRYFDLTCCEVFVNRVYIDLMSSLELSVGQAKAENLQQGTYILLGTFFWNTGWYFYEPWRAFNQVKYRKTSKILAGITKEGT